MDPTSDGGTSKRSSISSLHKLHITSNGSPKLSSNNLPLSQSPQKNIHSPSSAHHQNTTNTQGIATNNLQVKELEKFTRYFIKKTFQLIVQSRLKNSVPNRTDCKSSGSDWFNLSVVDLPKVAGRLKKTIDSISHLGFAIQSNWAVCCDISLQTEEDDVILLEKWILSNKYLTQNSPNKHNKSVTSNQPNPSPTNSSTTIYSVYNRMCLVLKTLVSAAHILPVYNVANKGIMEDNQIMCYRIYSDTPTYQNLKNTSEPSLLSSPNSKRNSMTKEDRSAIITESNENIGFINGNAKSNKKDCTSSINGSTTSSNSSNWHEYLSSKDLEYFDQSIQLGSIKSDISELNLSVHYHTDLRTSGNLMDKCRYSYSVDKYSRLEEDDCLTAAKQLLNGSNCLRTDKDSDRIADILHEKKTSNRDSFERYDNIVQTIDNTEEQMRSIIEPINPPFAEPTATPVNQENDPNLAFIETAFENLLSIDNQNSESYSSNQKTGYSNKSTQNGNTKTLNNATDPILVPQNRMKDAQYDRISGLEPNSTPKSLDSFVFVDLNVPFASEDKGHLSSFFHGPSPVFNNNSCDMLKSVDQLTNHLADIESDASQLDEFVDNVCAEKEEDIESFSSNSVSIF